MSKILTILKEITWLKAAVIRHPLPRLLASFLRHRDISLNRAVDETSYLFLGDRETENEAKDVEAFASYVRGKHRRHTSVSNATEELPCQASLCGFHEQAVLYDHMPRWVWLGCEWGWQSGMDCFREHAVVTPHHNFMFQVFRVSVTLAFQSWPETKHGRC